MCFLTPHFEWIFFFEEWDRLHFSSGREPGNDGDPANKSGGNLSLITG